MSDIPRILYNKVYSMVQNDSRIKMDKDSHDKFVETDVIFCNLSEDLTQSELNSTVLGDSETTGAYIEADYGVYQVTVTEDPYKEDDRYAIPLEITSVSE